MLSLIQYVFAAISGIIVGFSLGLIGGGGSILAVPLFLYFVGLDRMPNAVHVAVGTTALAVGINAYINSYMHFRRKNVAIRVGGLFAFIGVFGSLLGAYLGRITPGTALLSLFALSMIILGAYIALRKEPAVTGTKEEEIRLKYAQHRCPKLNKETTVKVVLMGFVVGIVSGYFGIGGGFLIVPSLMFSSGLCITRAIGTSLLSVGSFGVASGLEYAAFGEAILTVALLYIAGGVVGGYIGTALAVKAPKRTLRLAYGTIIILVGVYILFRTGVL